jgi:hypothetical protein
MKHGLCLTGSSSEDFTPYRNVEMRQGEEVSIRNISEVITILFSMNNSSFFFIAVDKFG